MCARVSKRQASGRSPGPQMVNASPKVVRSGRTKLAKRTKTSNRLGLDLGPGGGEATPVVFSKRSPRLDARLAPVALRREVRSE
jgi:hypothetical protein